MINEEEGGDNSLGAAVNSRRTSPQHDKRGNKTQRHQTRHQHHVLPSFVSAMISEEENTEERHQKHT